MTVDDLMLKIEEVKKMGVAGNDTVKIIDGVLVIGNVEVYLNSEE